MLPRRRLGLLLALTISAAPGAIAAELQIVNSSGSAIHEIYIAPAGNRDWGANRLRQRQPNVLARGESHTIADLAPGTYELRLVDRDGRECEIDALAIVSSYRLDLTSRKFGECTSSH